MSDSIGIMEGAYFVSKNDLLKWINDFFKIDIVKIEQSCTGALHCQIIDAIHPGKVKMHKVKWNAKHEHEFTANFKILQQAFEEMKIKKFVDVEKLIKGKYQDNLEFLQWMKRYFDINYSGSVYDALTRRGGSNLETDNMTKKRDCSKPHTDKLIAKPKNQVGNANTKIHTNNQGKVLKPSNSTKNITVDVNQDLKLREEAKTTSQEQMNSNNWSLEQMQREYEEMKDLYGNKLEIANDEIKTSKEEISTLKVAIAEIGRERDFYYSKLRDLEVLTSRPQKLEKEKLISYIETILFSDKCLEVVFDETEQPVINQK